MNVQRFSSLVLTSVFLAFLLLVSVASANTIQVAPTVTLVDGSSASEGSVVVSRADAGVYELSQTVGEDSVFGVVHTKPAMVFSTGADEVPVITEGIALVQVTAANGPIARGDLLVTSSSTGVAMRAGPSDDLVFAVALEGFAEDADGVTGLIQADVGVDHAQAVLAAQREFDVSESADETEPFSFVRAGVAIVLIVGALFFVLYSFRSAIGQGVVSVGRNPKARSSIVTLSFANIVFALILCAVIIFIAIAILILPL